MKKSIRKISKPNFRVVAPPIPKRFKRVKEEERVKQAFSNIPNITNETVAEHREEVLKGARKYKYPLAHSKHRIVVVSTSLLIAAVIGFFVYTSLALYKFQSSSAFMYRVTQIIPFPIAKAGKSFVAYENYLFELRRYEHYYQTQQKVDFSTTGKVQLANYKPKALQDVIDAAYIKQLAAQNHVAVTDADVTLEINALKAQNQSTDQQLADVTNKFFGWSIADLKREIKQELLAQKVAAKLDTKTEARATAVLTQLENGADFATIAAKSSDDVATKATGGQYADVAINAASTDVPPAVVQALSRLKVGQISGVVQAGNSLEIVKLLGNDGGKYKAAHISFNLTLATTYVKQYQKTHPVHKYIDFK